MRFSAALAAIVLVAVVVRMGYGYWWGGTGLDVDIYRDVADHVVAGDGFRSSDALPFRVRPRPDPFPEVDGPSSPYISHPPLHVLPFAAARVLGLRSFEGQLAVLSALAAAGVGCVGLLGRRIGGERVGLLAASIAAVHPLWLMYTGFLVSEATLLPVLAATLLALHHALTSRRWPWALATGVGAGLVSLTRPEGVVFLALATAALLAVGLRHRGPAAGVGLVAVVALGWALVAAPWLIRNQSEFGTWKVSLNGGVTALGSNCPEAYSGPRMGAFAPCYLVGVQVVDATIDDPTHLAAVDAARTDIALDYARSHKRRLAAVLVVRELRTAGTYPPGPLLDFDVEATSAHRRTAQVGFAVNLILLTLAAAGTVILVRARARIDLMVLATGVVMAVVTAALVYGSTRTRAPAEPALAILAAVAADRLLRSTRSRRSSPSTSGSPELLSPAAASESTSRLVE